MVTTASAILMSSLGYIVSNDITSGLIIMVIGMTSIQAVVVYFLAGKRIK